ncbi:MAG: cytochrome c oxidase subunit 3 [Mucilaginibacter polytrichastri]|nr:cytochrome c oxidase subunit 3 [Mucilaginibacter polytrichastri]
MNEKLALNPKKFNMWLFIIASFMLFAALTSGFIVYTGGNPSRGIKVVLPDAFKYSTAIILVSSITMYLAQRAARNLQFGAQKMYLALTILLGIAFFWMQLYCWTVLVRIGVYFINPNASQSFIYIFTGAHLLHIFAGLLLLANALATVIKNRPQVTNLYRMEMASLFWHFVDLVWIYLYIFLLLNQ